jgi:NAD(P)-dependent dehydrogenase (short-subunit alcohol dehydrogenase family)
MNSSETRSGLKPVTLITGYRGLAEKLIASFDSVSVLVKNPSAVASLQEQFPNAHFFVGNVASKTDCERWLEDVVRKYDSISALINNAAITGPVGKLHETDFDDFEKAIQVDLLAPIYLSKLVLKEFLKTGSGTIINLSGGGATFPRPHFSAYGTAKTALVRLTELLAEEYPQFRFYAISPGALKTPMLEAMLKLPPEKLGTEHVEAKRRWEEGGEDPQKAADLAVWLIRNRPMALNGKLISAIWDDYKNAPEYPKSIGWWTLRRVDEKLLTNLNPAGKENKGE